MLGVQQQVLGPFFRQPDPTQPLPYTLRSARDRRAKQSELEGQRAALMQARRRPVATPRDFPYDAYHNFARARVGRDRGGGRQGGGE